MLTRVATVQHTSCKPLVHSFFHSPRRLCCTFFFASHMLTLLVTWLPVSLRKLMQWRRMSVSSHHWRSHLHAGKLTHSIFSWLQKMNRVTTLPSLLHHQFLLFWLIPTSIQTYSFSSYSFTKSLLMFLPSLSMAVFLSFISEQSLHKNCLYLHISVLLFSPESLSLIFWFHDSPKYILIKDINDIAVTEPTGQFCLSFHFGRIWLLSPAPGPTLHLAPRTPCWYGCYLSFCPISISLLTPSHLPKF